MIKSSVLIACTLLFFACTKTSNSNNPNPQPSLIDSNGIISSCLLVQPQGNFILHQTFHYDVNGNLTSFSYTGALYSPYKIRDTGTYSFTYDPATRLITSYKTLDGSYDYPIDTTLNLAEHLVVYDNQNRVLTDSETTMNGVTITPAVISRYVYSDQLAVWTIPNWFIDSLTIIDGNVSRQAYFEIHGATTYADYINDYVPNVNFINPYYNEKMLPNIRIFLTMIWDNDYVSKNTSDFIRGEKMTWVKDSKGRVASGTGDQGTQVTFVYQ